MAQTINGKFIQSLPRTEGDSARGHWVRGGVVIEYGEEYPRKAAFTLFGEDKVNAASTIPQGLPVQITFVPESREYEGKWYTENRCIDIRNQMPTATQPQFVANPTPVSQSSYPYVVPPQTNPMQPANDPDLPF